MQVTLGRAVKLWPTPTVSTGAQTKENPTPRQTGGTSLAGAVKLWPTPNASDNRDRGSMRDPAIQRRIKLGKQVGLSMAVKDGANQETGSLNPQWVEWLMGFPEGWTDLNS